MLRFLIVFWLVFSLQFPAWAACPLPTYTIVPPRYYPCVNNPLSDVGCPPITNKGIIGSWQECTSRSVYRVYFVHQLFKVSFSQYYTYYIESLNGVGFPSTPLVLRPAIYNNGYTTVPPSKIGSFIHPEYECWCPPPACITLGFPACVGAKIITRFPFDIFLNIPAAAINCPSVQFFGHSYDLCWLYELMRWLKYPIALSLLIKLAMQL